MRASPIDTAKRCPAQHLPARISIFALRQRQRLSSCIASWQADSGLFFEPVELYLAPPDLTVQPVRCATLKRIWGNAQSALPWLSQECQSPVRDVGFDQYGANRSMHRCVQNAPGAMKNGQKVQTRTQNQCNLKLRTLKSQSSRSNNRVAWLIQCFLR